MSTAFGILNINKPVGCTSRRVVDRVERLLPRVKIGHAGTLDPLACGVVVLCVGSATRLIERVHSMPKSYTGEFLLGRTSPSEDIELEPTLLDSPPIPTAKQIIAALPDFTGDIEQRPPQFSALKVAGKRAYELARAGKTAVLQSRPVSIYDLKLSHYDYPTMVLDIQCSGGTYVRSLGRDIAERLGTGAVMAALTRTAIGDFTLAEATALDELDRDNIAARLQSAARAVPDLPVVTINDVEEQRLRNGLEIEARPELADAAEMSAINAAGRLIALIAMRRSGNLGPTRVFP